MKIENWKVWVLVAFVFLMGVYSGIHYERWSQEMDAYTWCLDAMKQARCFCGTNITENYSMSNKWERYGLNVSNIDLSESE